MKLRELNTSLVSSRDSFNNTWLCEMPSGLGVFETYDALKYSVTDLIKHKIPVEVIHRNFNRISSGEVQLYWYGTSDGVITDLIVEMHNKPEGLVVSMTGKNPKLKGRAPFASSMYSDILKNTDKSIRLVSDKVLSDEGYKIWKTLLKMGHKVSVYNSQKPGQTLQSFNTPEEMDEFFKHDDTDYEKYQYVLSESTEALGHTRARFNLRRSRELIKKMPLQD